MTEEIWKKIPNYPAYEVSNKGRIRRVPDISYIKPYRGSVVLSKDDVQKHYSVKKLVRMLFP